MMVNRSRLLLPAGSYARHLGWAGLVIGLSNIALGVVLRHGVGWRSFIFGALAWSAAAAGLLAFRRG